MRNLLWAASAVGLAIAAPAYADANDDLKKLVDDVWAAPLKGSVPLDVLEAQDKDCVAAKQAKLRLLSRCRHHPLAT